MRLFFILFCSLSFAQFNPVPSDIYIWPLPSSLNMSTEFTSTIYPSKFTFKTNANSDIISLAIKRYVGLTFPNTPELHGNNPNNNIIYTLDLSVKDDSEDTLQYGMDESYQLTIPSQTNSSIASLTSNTIWGALRGLETFSQLVVFNTTTSYYETYTATITDSPRFGWRGIMIDLSRHYQTISSLKQVLDSMSYVKLNTLHLHISDDQSFPFESKKYPNLWNGAYSNNEKYTQTDMDELVTYAKNLGIRVVAEFDIPGHATSWCTGYPEICPSPSCETPLNPASNFTWSLLDALINEVTDIFFDDYIHLGGDEVNTNCYSSTPSIEQWMKENNFTASQALEYFDIHVQNISYYKYNKQIVNWVEVFDQFGKDIDPKLVTIQVWKSKETLQQVVASGFRAILSDSDLWYLDNYNHADLRTTWQKMYMNEPLENITNPQQQKLVMGGEACMWTENTDTSVLQQTIWPRAAAVAERLWSPRSANSTGNAQNRMGYFRCLLLRRGVIAAPRNNPSARAPPPGPGGCFSQR